MTAIGCLRPPSSMRWAEARPCSWQDWTSAGPASMLDAGAASQADRAIAKLFATDSAFEVATNAPHVHGAMGLSRECGLERIVRDARGGMTVEGTSQVQRLVIGREQLDISAFT